MFIDKRSPFDKPEKLLFKVTKFISVVFSFLLWNEEVKAKQPTLQSSQRNCKMKSTILLALLISQGLQFISAAGLKVEARDIDLGESDYQCSDGLYVAPHETQCELYYICAAGGTPTHLYQCRDDQLFDLKYDGCNYKELVDCGDRVPYACPSPNGTFPAKQGACDSNYYVCTNGVAINETCLDGGIFDASLSSCAAPGTIICPSTTTIATRTTPGPFECPEPNGYFSSPYSCSQFYICQDGIAFLKDCPAGLYYNAAIVSCDWPYNVDCKLLIAFGGNPIF